jgi:hypothetical protein
VYPDFISYDKTTRTLKFEPYGQKYQGREYYFIMNLVEKNSKYISNSYYCSINVKGEIVEGSFEYTTSEASESSDSKHD